MGSHISELSQFPKIIPRNPNPLLEGFSLQECVHSLENFEAWKKSPAYCILIHLLEELNSAVRGKARTVASHNNYSETIRNLLQILNQVDTLITENPPEAHIKFANPAFRIFLETIKQRKDILLNCVVSNQEAQEYFLLSFGSWARIDFGSGHEFNFLAFIACLDSLGIIQKDDYASIVLEVFWAYWKIIRRIQLSYRPPPAGSLGVWGLDDYVLLPFLFGSSQLIQNPEITPKSVFTPEIAERYSEEYSFCLWIHFLLKTKGDLAFRAPTLLSLQECGSFDEINQGIMQRYKKALFDKPVIAEQFRFGKILSYQ